MKTISLILPVYNEQETLAKLFQELMTLEKDLKSYRCEFIFIDDGSKDNSFQILKDFHRTYTQKGTVKIIRFSRNFGHQIAITAGQDIALGEAIIVMDTDLQDPPSVCLDLIEEWEQGFDIVFAQRRKYKTTFIKHISAFIFYRLLKKIASVDIPVDTGDFRLLSKKVNDEMKKFREKSRFMRGISSLVGFKQTSVLFDRQERYAGKPAYTFWKSLRLALDGITGFSLFPLKLISWLGCLLSIGSFLIGTGYVISSILSNHTVSGWASMMMFVIFIGGLQLLMIGILGEYIGRIYIEVLNRPLYSIDVILDDK